MSWVNRKFEEYRGEKNPTLIEKAVLAHADPANLFCFVVGLLTAAYGLWQHSMNFVLVGLGVGILGDIISWSRK